MTNDFYLITFTSSHFVIKMNKLLKDKKINTSIISTPGQVKAGCGLSLRISVEDKDEALELIKTMDTKYESIYFVKSESIKKEYISIS